MSRIGNLLSVTGERDLTDREISGIESELHEVFDALNYAKHQLPGPTETVWGDPAGVELASLLTNKRPSDISSSKDWWADYEPAADLIAIWFGRFDRLDPGERLPAGAVIEYLDGKPAGITVIGIRNFDNQLKEAASVANQDLGLVRRLALLAVANPDREVSLESLNRDPQQGLLARLEPGLPRSVPLMALAADFQISVSALASLVDIEPELILRWLSDPETAGMPDHLDDLRTLALEALENTKLSPHRIGEWFITPEQSLGNVRPIDVIKQGRFEDVLAAIGNIR